MIGRALNTEKSTFARPKRTGGRESNGKRNIRLRFQLCRWRQLGNRKVWRRGELDEVVEWALKAVGKLKAETKEKEEAVWEERHRMEAGEVVKAVEGEEGGGLKGVLGVGKMRQVEDCVLL